MTSETAALPGALVSGLEHREASAVRPGIHIWLPGMVGGGGIESFSGHFTMAVRRALPTAAITAFVKNDSAGAVVQRLEGSEVRVHGTGDVWLRVRSHSFGTRVVVRGVLERPDLIIVGHLHFAPLARRLLRGRRPYWVVAHGVESWNVDHRGRLEALRGAERILAVSEHTRRRIVAESAVDPDRVTLLPNTIDAARFTPGSKPARLLRRFRLRPDQPVVLTVARLAGAERDKGYDRILNALPSVRQHCPDVRYLIVGAGPDRARVERRIADLGLRDSVILAGRVPDADLPDFYRLCDLFAMPSTREGFGIVYLEAAATGRMVLAGDRDGAVDALCGGELGILVDPDDRNAIVDSMQAVLQGRCAHPLAGSPEVLHQRVAERFGLAAFQKRVSSLFADRWNGAGGGA